MASEFGVACVVNEHSVQSVKDLQAACLDPPANLNLTLVVPCAPSTAAHERWKHSARLQNSISSNPESSYLSFLLLEGPWAIMQSCLHHLSRAERWIRRSLSTFSFFSKLDGIFMASEPWFLCTHDAMFSSTTACAQSLSGKAETQTICWWGIKAFKGGPFRGCTQPIKNKQNKTTKKQNTKKQKINQIDADADADIC